MVQAVSGASRETFLEWFIEGGALTGPGTGALAERLADRFVDIGARLFRADDFDFASDPTRESLPQGASP